MTALLVSVRDAGEALAALDGGADWIDVKEPSRGALGRADLEVITKVVRTVAGRRPVSVALGELNDETISIIRQLPKGLELVKVGLAGCAMHPDWRGTWADVATTLSTDVGLAAVAYADWRRADAPSPREVLQTGRAIGCRALLVDTFDKCGPNSLDGWRDDGLSDFVGDVRATGMLLALAGSLTLENVDRALELAPNLFAVRGAACRGGRDGAIDAARVRSFAAALNSRQTKRQQGTVWQHVRR